jgi:eukaryotic-like serine/threonine-protein kinase
MIKYITRKPLWFNILVGLGIIIIFFLIFMLSLKWITRHGESKTVPAVTGKNIDDVQQMLSDGGFELIIQDSVYYDSIPPGTVVKQFPEPDQVVKVNRTVYVMINRFVPPDVTIPNIIGAQLRGAEMSLNSVGLKLGDTTSKKDFAKGTVLEMLVNGKVVNPGDKVKIGTRIDMVISGGIPNEDAMVVPNLVGMRFDEAVIYLESLGLSVASVVPDPGVTDNASAYVRSQRPEPRTADGVQVFIRPGQMVDLFLSRERPVMDTTLNQLP